MFQPDYHFSLALSTGSLNVSCTGLHNEAYNISMVLYNKSDKQEKLVLLYILLNVI